MSKFSEAKELFIDSVENPFYVTLDSSQTVYNQIIDAIQKPIKMVLLFGKPGTGKTVILDNVYRTLEEEMDIFLLKQPPLNNEHVHNYIYKSITTFEPDKTDDVNQVKKLFKNIGKESIVALLDEAQLYSEIQLEQIRLLSDTGMFKFVISVHKTDKEDIIAKEHFKTRIWETIELSNISLNELHLFLEKKFLMKNLYNIVTMMDSKNYKLIYKLTGGNLRSINRLLYKLFDILEYYENNIPSKIRYDKMENKFIEMAAIDLEII